MGSYGTGATTTPAMVLSPGVRLEQSAREIGD